MSPPLSISAFFVLLKNHALLIFGVLTTSFIFLLFAPLGVLAAFLLACVLLLRRRKLASAFVLVSPFIVTPMLSFGFGLLSYTLGHAHLRTVGHPGASNIDRDSRIRVVSSGCVVDGSQLFTHPPHNLAIHAMTGVFGPPRNAYLGPYPTAQEAWALIDAQSVPVRVQDDQLLLGTKKLPLFQSPMATIIRTTSDTSPSAKLLEDRALLLRDDMRLFVLDVRSGKRIATYFRDRKPSKP